MAKFVYDHGGRRIIACTLQFTVLHRNYRYQKFFQGERAKGCLRYIVPLPVTLKLIVRKARWEFYDLNLKGLAEYRYGTRIFLVKSFGKKDTRGY